MKKGTRTKYTRKRSDLKLPENLLVATDNYCLKKSISRTFYIESLIRNHLKKEGVELPENELTDHGSYDVWGGEEIKLRRVF
jgi:hypothetical protein